MRLRLVLLGLCLFGACRRSTQSADTVRLGLFPNLTHAPALVALERGIFTQALGSVKLETKAFSAGPEAMEAIYAGALDACFIGPIPALNGYLRSDGRALKIVAGAASGGAALVVQADSPIVGAKDLAGKKLASPQLGNTQDLALRHYLERNGLKTKEQGGDVQIVPIANADTLQLMRAKQLDGAWVPEPWVTRLLHEAGGRILVDERDLWPDRKFPITVLVVSQKFLEAQPQLVEKLVRAHVENLTWMASHADEVRTLLPKALLKLGQKALPPEIIDEALKRIDFTSDPMPAALMQLASDARKLGYMPAAGKPEEALDLRFVKGSGTP